MHTRSPVLLKVHEHGHAVRSAVEHGRGLIRPVLCWFIALLLAWLFVMTGLARGATLFVDSRIGDDRNNGLSPTNEGSLNGPLHTLQRAIQIAGKGDEIRLTNNGTAYYGGITLFGERHSGYPLSPFTITGNGAVVSGAKPVPAGRWEFVQDQVWRLEPLRKAYYQLLRDGKALPETACPPDAKSLPPLPEGQWCAWRGAIYYHAVGVSDPNGGDFALADEEVGITLLDVHDVIIQNVTLQHFRLDGINAHDRCREVLLDHVTCAENGRSGVTVAGTSHVYLLESELKGNRRYSLLISEHGVAELEGCRLDQPPTTEPLPKDR